MLCEIWFKFSEKELKIRRGWTMRHAEESCCTILVAAWMLCFYWGLIPGLEQLWEGISISWESRTRQNSLVSACLSLVAGIQRAAPSREQKFPFVAWRGLGGGCKERRSDPSRSSLLLKSATEKELTGVIVVFQKTLESCWESQIGANVLQDCKLWISLCLILWWC